MQMRNYLIQYKISVSFCWQHTEEILEISFYNSIVHKSEQKQAEKKAFLIYDTVYEQPVCKSLQNIERKIVFMSHDFRNLSVKVQNYMPNLSYFSALDSVFNFNRQKKKHFWYMIYEQTLWKVFSKISAVEVEISAFFWSWDFHRRYM